MVSRARYQRAKARHKALQFWVYAYIFALVAYGLLFGWARTENPALYRWLWEAGIPVENLLAPVIPAIDNVAGDFHASGFGMRVAFARHAVAVGWLFGLAGIAVFGPMMVKDRKFLKRGKHAMRIKIRSGELYLWWMLAALACGAAFALWFFYGGAYSSDYESGRSGYLFRIRFYDSAAVGAMCFPFLCLWIILSGLIQMRYALKSFGSVLRWEDKVAKKRREAAGGKIA